MANSEDNLITLDQAPRYNQLWRLFFLARTTPYPIYLLGPITLTKEILLILL
nr:MAG TPA: hypothetical protein [Caudoviricetes sp.]